MAGCESCHAAVIWTVTEKGNRMPVDFKPDPSGNLVLDWTVRGAPISRVVGEPNLFDPNAGNEQRYKSHFATCPNAKGHRKTGTDG